MLQADQKPKVLTVGDGDLSLSLALTRAYGEHVSVTASVLESNRQELLRIFPEAPLDELNRRGVKVLYGVDATQLHTLSETNWDLISFHHPHLGISNVEDCDESKRAKLHHKLLCHYLHSAKQISKRVHVCLTGTQPTTWNLEKAASLQNLRLVQKLVDSKPFAHVVWSDVSEETKGLPEPAKVEPNFAAPRKYRNGKLGKHFLARYGYRHRRTEGVLFKGSIKDANVSESMHFVFAEKEESTQITNNNEANIVCPICRQTFETKSALELHLKRPVRPPAIPKVESLPNGDETATLRKAEQSLDAKDSEPTVLEQRCDDKGGTILTVPSSSDGKRLRWFLQHSTISGMKFTKRLAESTIQAGLVSVNGEVAQDSSRILKDKDMVTIQQQTPENQNSTTNPASAIPKKNSPTIEIVERSPPTSDVKWLVAVKPSGMRTKGKFPGTLESILCEQEQTMCSCISSLETSCSGLCVIVTGSDSSGISVMHTMTVLVHGKLARDEWVPSRDVKLMMEAKWRQKKKKRKLAAASTEETQLDEESQETVPAKIDLVEVCDNSSCPLSTVTVATSEPTSSSICHYFRQVNYPVVGDSFCKHEYAKLKRSIRNRIKNKLCMGCYKVDITTNNETTTIQLPSPDKLSAAHWEKFLTDDA